MAVKSHKLGPGLLTFGEVGSPLEWGAQVRKCTVEPDSEDGDVLAVLNGEEVTEDDEDTYNLTGEILQSYDAQSLLVWCHLNHREQVPFTFRPVSDQELGVKGTVIVKKLAIGGEVKTRNTSEFEFRGVGDYDLIDGAGEVITTYGPIA